MKAAKCHVCGRVIGVSGTTLLQHGEKMRAGLYSKLPCTGSLATVNRGEIMPERAMEQSAWDEHPGFGFNQQEVDKIAKEIGCHPSEVMQRASASIAASLEAEFQAASELCDCGAGGLLHAVECKLRSPEGKTRSDEIYNARLDARLASVGLQRLK